MNANEAAGGLAASAVWNSPSPRATTGYDLWRDFPYEHEIGKLPIDVINGGPALREWGDDPGATPADLDALTGPDKTTWTEERRAYLR